ncbi:uncharacterized protein LOC143362245 [Halictus rubicundus]|uniref:uncharacterized protein LOC143362245 n=1 Tax=Halictus rubicundus TaxID=77578 RepID=UPI00403756B0
MANKKKMETPTTTKRQRSETEVRDPKYKEEDTISNKRKRENIINQYPASHRGPAYVTAIFNNSARKPRNSQNALMLAKILNKSHEGVEEIKNEGYGKFNIKFKTGNHANQFVKTENKDLQEIKVFIPKFRITRKGLIKGFSTDCEIGDIKKYTDSPVPILEARRLNRKTRNLQTGLWEWKPSESIVITFEGTNLPDYIKLYNLIHTPVELYIEPLKICYNCFKTGHTTKFCRSEQICKNCGNPGHNLSDCPTTDAPTCAHCRESHQTLHPSCSTFQTTKEINKQMSLLNISFYEAKQIVTRTNPEIKSKSVQNNKENYPPLRSQSQNHILQLKAIGGQQAPASSSTPTKAWTQSTTENNYLRKVTTTAPVQQQRPIYNPHGNNPEIRQNSSPSIIRTTTITKKTSNPPNTVVLTHSPPNTKPSPVIKQYKPAPSTSSKP